MAEIAVPAALGLVDGLLRYLNDRQISGRGDVEQIKNRLLLMKAYLEDMDGNEDHTQVMKAHKQLFRDLANGVEDVFDEYMFRACHKFHEHKFTEKFDRCVRFARLGNPSRSLREINSMITVIKNKIDEETQFANQLNSISSSRRTSINVLEEGESSGFSRPPHLPDDEEIVGFEEPRKKLMDELKTNGLWSRHKTISVVGPGGCGKTCLVKNVYESETVRSLFDCRAWVQLSWSQPFNREEVLRSILKQFCASKDEPIPSQDIEIQARLRNYVHEKRYVVVLDDIWNKKHWECIQSALLPTGSIGSSSRIIVTTRNSDAASTCVHRLDGLSFPKAWELFCKKAFQTRRGKGECPPELENFSQRIVKKCEGLPLAIVAIGSLLSKKKQVPSEWQKVHDSLGSEIETNSNLSIISKILQRSYKDLPPNLKRCFLYFSIFPENYAIERGRLVRLWIAEGFVLEGRGKTLEDVAEDYLDELIGRNLVYVNEWGFDGTARYCRVLNLIHEFIIQKSEEVNFVKVLAKAGSSSSSSLKARRLSIREDCNTLSQNKDLNYVRSAFFFKRGDDVSPSLITDLLDAFRLLKVLDLRNTPLDKFPKSVASLVLLKYLCLRNTNIKKVPKSIGKLSYLETLDLERTNVTKLPKEIGQLNNLRHLLVCCPNYENYEAWDSVQGVELFEGIKFLTSLQKLSFVRPDKNHKIIKELGALTQLRKLGLVKLEKKGGRDLCTVIQKMKKLSILDVSSKSKEEPLELDDMHIPPPHLQRLYLKGHLKTFPGWISKLDNLFRISLRWSKLESSPLEALQGLPHLIELQMDDAFVGEVLEFAAGGFKKLKTLQIKQLDKLHTVVVQESLMPILEGAMPVPVMAMPVLEKLTLCNCPNLKKLPFGIDKLSHLKELLLYNMPREFISKLEKNSDYWEIVSHIHVIHSYVEGSLHQNLSPAM